MAPRVLWLMCVLLLTVPAHPVTVWADSQGAEALVRQGTELFKEGRYAEAAQAFLGAYELEPEPELLFNIAWCYEKLGDNTLARQYYERFLAAPDISRSKSAKARERLNAIDARLKGEKASVETRSSAPEPVAEEPRRNEEKREEEKTPRTPRKDKKKKKGKKKRDAAKNFESTDALILGDGGSSGLGSTGQSSSGRGGYGNEGQLGQGQASSQGGEAIVFVEAPPKTPPVNNTNTKVVAHSEPEPEAQVPPVQRAVIKPAVVKGKADVDWAEFQLVYQEIGPVYTYPGELPQFVVSGRDAGEAEVLELPLEHTHVDVTLSGPVGRVILNQAYDNPYDEVIEAVYTFPLPENSAVDGMKMVIGERVIEGVVRDRETARQMYEDAKAQGYTAALLEQERPNIFTQSVANIAPRKKINVEIRYLQDLTYDSGQYEFVFPMVVGPRYAPDGLADAHRIQPAIVGKGQRSGHDISLSLRADAGMPISSFDVPTHDVEGKLRDGKLSLKLASMDEIPNRDFVLRYGVSGEQPRVALLSEWSKDASKGHFTMVVQPPELDVNSLVGTRELVFVVDVSGSMRGVPMALSQEAMMDMLRKLRPVDTFNIITFASGTEHLFADPRPANAHNIGVAMEFVEKLEAKGGTDMLEGVTAALGAEIEAGMHRHVVFMTDGYIGNEEEILEAVGQSVERLAKKQATVRVFGFGVGSSTNRYLIEGLAHAGEGVADYALNREDPARVVQAFFHVLDSPVMTDVSFDFGDLDVDFESFYPAQIPDLFASHPMVVHGSYTKSGKGTLTLKGTWQGRPLAIPVEVELSSEQAHQGAMGTLWARARVEQLERDALFGANAASTVKAITQLGLDFGIVTAYTSFIAIDSSEKVGGGKPRRIDQATDKPEGVQGGI